MTSRSYIILSGLCLALWIFIASAMFFIYPLVLVASAFLGWMLGRSADQNNRNSIAYAYSVGPSFVAAIFSMCWWFNKPNETFEAIIGWLSIANFILLLCGFSIARHIFPQETTTHSK